MLSISTKIIGPGKQDIINYPDIPELFAEAIERHWVRDDRVVLSVTLDQQQRIAANWRTLGQLLTEAFLAKSLYIGLCFDGDYAFDDHVLRWLQTIRDHTNRRRVEAGVVELKWILSPHAVAPSSNLNTTWTSLQAAPDAGWLQTFWEDLDSKYFHVGCDMILTAYPAQVWDENPRGKPLTIGAFTATLDRAHSWLIPLSDERGFLVGTTQNSSLYQRLRNGDLRQ
jgi:hypothetical protein